MTLELENLLEKRRNGLSDELEARRKAREERLQYHRKVVTCLLQLAVFDVPIAPMVFPDTIELVFDPSVRIRLLYDEYFAQLYLKGSCGAGDEYLVLTVYPDQLLNWSEGGLVNPRILDFLRDNICDVILRATEPGLMEMVDYREGAEDE